MDRVLVEIARAGDFDRNGLEGVLCLEIQTGAALEFQHNIPADLGEQLEALLLRRSADYGFYCNGIRGESPCKVCRGRFGVTESGGFGDIVDTPDGQRHVSGFPTKLPYFLNSGSVALGLLGFQLLITSRLFLHHLRDHRVVAHPEVWETLRGLRYGGAWDWLMRRYHVKPG